MAPANACETRRQTPHCRLTAGKTPDVRTLEPSWVNRMAGVRRARAVAKWRSQLATAVRSKGINS